MSFDVVGSITFSNRSFLLSKKKYSAPVVTPALSQMRRREAFA